MSVRVDVAPAVIDWALEQSGWDRSALPKAGKSAERWIKGDEKPTLKQLRDFAGGANVPYGMLFLEEPPKREMPIPDMRTMGNTGVREPSGDLLSVIHSYRYKQGWYREYADKAGYEKLSFVGSATLRDTPQDIARRIRDLLEYQPEDRTKEIKDNPRKYLVETLQDVGVLVVISGMVGDNTYRGLDLNEFRGFTLSDPVVPLIFVNGKDTVNGQVFTLMHELAHLYLGHSALSDCPLDMRDSQAEEIWCNKVAAEVLLPGQALKNDYQNCEDEEIKRLSHKYGVSTLTVLKSIYDNKLINWDTFIDLYRKQEREIQLYLQTHSSSGGGNYYSNKIYRLGRPFISAVAASASEGNTSYREAYRLLGARGETFDKLVEKAAR